MCHATIVCGVTDFSIQSVLSGLSPLLSLVVVLHAAITDIFTESNRIKYLIEQCRFICRYMYTVSKTFCGAFFEFVSAGK